MDAIDGDHFDCVLRKSCVVNSDQPVPCRPSRQQIKALVSAGTAQPASDTPSSQPKFQANMTATFKSGLRSLVGVSERLLSVSGAEVSRESSLNLPRFPDPEFSTRHLQSRADRRDSAQSHVCCDTHATRPHRRDLPNTSTKERSTLGAPSFRQQSAFSDFANCHKSCLLFWQRRHFGLPCH